MSNPLEFYDHKIESIRTDDLYQIFISFDKNQPIPSRVHRINRESNDLESMIGYLENHPGFNDERSQKIIQTLKASRQNIEVDLIFLKSIYMSLNQLVNEDRGPQ